MRYIIQKLLDDPIRIILIVIIIACLVLIFRAVREVRGWWRAWSIEEQKKRPPVRYPVHFDKKA